jgi:hypothetical protein
MLGTVAGNLPYVSKIYPILSDAMNFNPTV